MRSSANVVIWAGDEPFGALDADSVEPDVFDKYDVQVCSHTLISSAAVERQRLSSRAQDFARQRELLLKESVHRVKNVLSCVHAVA